MNNRKMKKQKMIGKKRLENAKKIILAEVDRLEKNFALKHCGGSYEYDFDKKNFDVFQVHHLMEVFGIDPDKFDIAIYDLMKPIGCECKWPVEVDYS